MGERVEKGLFRSSKGLLIYADINPGANLIRKEFLDAYDDFLISKVPENPIFKPEMLEKLLLDPYFVNVNVNRKSIHFNFFQSFDHD